MTIGLLGRLRFENPILAKDLRTRMRGGKAFIVQGIYVGVLAAMMGLFYTVWRLSHMAGASPMTISSEVGRYLYLLLFESQAALVVLITPALTAGTITLEHEQRTYELLACTRLAPRTIVAGKLLSGWLFVVMLLICSLPMAALCLMFGGVSGAEIFWSFVGLCLFALLFGSIGVFWSALFTRTIAAVMLSYGSVLVYLILTVISENPTQSGTSHSLNPFVFLIESTQQLHLYQTTVPGWLPGLILLPLASLLFATWAVARAPHFVVERAPLLRGLLTVLLAAVTVFGLLSNGTAAHGKLLESFPIVLLTGAGVLLLLSLLFATGDRPASQPRSLIGWMLTGLDPRAAFSSQLRGGWVFLIFLAAVFSASLLLGDRLTVAGLRLRHADAIFAVLAAVLFAYSALGALGAALNSRRIGIALIVIVLVVTQLVPGIIWADYSSWATTDPSPALYTLYLAPYAGLAAIGIPDLAKGLPDNIKPPAAPPLWLGTAVLYLILAVAGFALAEIVYQARRSRLASRRAELQSGD